MKNLFFVSVAFSIFSGTSFTTQAQGPRFINGISFAASTPANIVSNEPTVQLVTLVTKKSYVQPVIFAGVMATEMCSKLQFKFAQLLNRDIESLTNISLLSFIDDWWRTKYRYGGTGRSGIDCSAFVGLLMGSVYGLKMPRTAREQYATSERISKDDMLEGDMVFFNTRGGVSHVGLYLGGGYFVHASVSNGVTISNLEEGYYAKKFIGAGRAVDVNASMAKVLVN